MIPEGTTIFPDFVLLKGHKCKDDNKQTRYAQQQAFRFRPFGNEFVSIKSEDEKQSKIWNIGETISQETLSRSKNLK